jgi:hypothetical protein
MSAPPHVTTSGTNVVPVIPAASASQEWSWKAVAGYPETSQARAHRSASGVTTKEPVTTEGGGP